MNSVLDSPNPRRLMSLASRINAIHRALTAEELAELLQMSRITILRRAKRGSIPSFRVGSCVRFDSAAIATWLMQQGVQRMSKGCVTQALTDYFRVAGESGVGPTSNRLRLCALVAR